MELWQYAFLFAVGLAAGFINVMAGGGSILTLPVLIFLGLDSALANGTNRVAILIQSGAAVASFRRREVQEFRRSAAMALWTLPGAIAGALFAVNISDLWFQRILAGVMMGTIVTLLIPQAERPAAGEESGERRERWIYPAMLGIGFYGGFIQVSVGFLLMAALYHILRMSLVYVNLHKVTIVLFYMVPTIVVFALTGNVDWLLGVVLGLGSATGAWWAAHVSVKGGEGTIRLLLVAAILLMALKLLEVF